ncbi:MAG: heme lyase CcmF/NrfE family subunit, partial [Burkholderiales bacterium]
MLPELGVIALACGFVTALLLAGAGFSGARILARSAAQAQFVFVAFAFGVLAWSFAQGDFSIQYVAQHSNSKLPLEYRLAAVWGGHEGSLLLWTLILAGWTVAVALRSHRLPDELAARVLGAMGAIAAGFLAFALFASSPFQRLLPPALEGRDLNPLLQDPGMVFHPPLLYMGYVGFSVAFAFAVAALTAGRLEAGSGTEWARWARPWTVCAWVFLTLGIALGSFWAYYELGWGGWWFWDPVENASLMPWLAGTALVHSTVVMEKRDALKVWTILLAIVTFSLSLLGTFLVRSGVLTSVHSFAVDPSRGVAILIILTVFIGGSLALYAWRAPVLQQGGLFAPISREGALVVNNLFLATACATVFIGTLYPLALEALTEAKISVGAPFFNATFIPLVIPLLLLLPVGQLLAWKRGNLLGTLQRLYAAFGLALLATLVLLAFTIGGPVAAPLGIGLGAYLIAGAISEIVGRAWSRGTPFSVVVRKA